MLSTVRADAMITRSAQVSTVIMPRVFCLLFESIKDVLSYCILNTYNVGKYCNGGLFLYGVVDMARGLRVPETDIWFIFSIFAKI